MIFILAGHYEHAGTLGEIVVKADQASVAQALGGNPLRALSAPKQSLQRQLADGLRYLVRDTLRLNQADGPADGWLTHDALWLVSKPIADQLRAYLLTQGVEGIPSSNATFFNMLQDQGVIQTNAQDKAIWKATIDNGLGWRNTFTLLRLSPALIWTDANDRPAAYSGTVQVDESGTPDAQSLPSTLQKPPQVDSATPFAATTNALFEHLPPSSSDPAEVEALMALLDNIKAPLESRPDTSPSQPETPLPDAGNEDVTETLTAPPPSENRTGPGIC